MANGNAHFVIVDYVIFALAVGASICIGIYFALSGGKQKTTSEYLMGNRHMKILPVALSLMVSFESSIMMLGFPAEIYVYGVMFWLAIIAFSIVNVLAVFIWVPLIHPLKVTSVYEYLELRYSSKAMRTLGTVIGGLNYIFYMGIVLYGPAIALRAVTHFPLWASVVVVAAASVIYTSIGGLKAVIWTDVFQSVIMFMGVFAIIIKGTIVAGGGKNIFDIAAKTGRLNFFNFDPDPTVRHTFWSLVIGAGLRYMSLMFNQSTVQRISATPNIKAGYRVMLFAAPAFFLTFTLAALEGLVAYAYFYTTRCDPLASKKIYNSNQVIPYMVLEIFQNYPGMPGLFMASLFSASLSTLSSGLSSLTAQTTEDFIKPKFKGLSEYKTTLIAKLSVIVYGLMAVAVSFMIIQIEEVPISQIGSSILASFSGPLTGLMLFSAYCPWAKKQAAVIGTLISMALVFWISMGQNFSTSLKRTPWLPLAPTDQCLVPGNISVINGTSITTTLHYFILNGTESTVEPKGLDRLYSLSYQWLGAVGVISTLLIGTIISFITGRPNPDTVDVRYILPIFDHLFPFLPKKIRKFLYFGVKFEKREELLKAMDNGVMDYEKEIRSENLQLETQMLNDSRSEKETE